MRTKTMWLAAAALIGLAGAGAEADMKPARYGGRWHCDDDEVKGAIGRTSTIGLTGATKREMSLEAGETVVLGGGPFRLEGGSVEVTMENNRDLALDVLVCADRQESAHRLGGSGSVRRWSTTTRFESNPDGVDRRLVVIVSAAGKGKAQLTLSLEVEAAVGTDEPEKVDSASDALNAAVLAAADAMSGGRYCWFKTDKECTINDTGLPHSVSVQHDGGTWTMRADPHGSYCSGFTFAAVTDVIEARGLARTKTKAELSQFQKLWYVTLERNVLPDGAKGWTNDQLREQALGLALSTIGLGREIPLDDAMPGDFVQIARVSESGHSTVFKRWLVDGGRRVGFTYRSSQTGGIADRTECFHDVGCPAVCKSSCNVVKHKTHAARLAPAAE